jgi:hypothetical protein
MLVLVRYNDDNYDIVEDYCLEYLIITGKVIEFSRTDQWVSVDEEPTREKPYTMEYLPCLAPAYSGPERRKFSHRNFVHTHTLTAST